ncbi:MAG: glycoside hydrolase family 3 C-terminal domain-containing protein, partial [Bacteroidales bacterium]|nr:glycoside hydrolase family 3 C-terminal domain-containing protein [Bacteroidales bacterium]
MTIITTALASLMSILSLSTPVFPILGPNNIKEIIRSMTLEQKASMVVGTNRGFMSPPEAAPGMVVRPAPDFQAMIAQASAEGTDVMEAVTAFSRGKVQGAAGEGYKIEDLGIPGMVYADGPAGLRIDPTRRGDDKEYYCTAFPTGAVLAASFDQDLVFEITRAMGEEVREYGVDILLAPAINIHRNPLCGRNFEYFSEDPLLAGKMASAYVAGIQSNGVGTSVKHFAVNNQETYRNGIDVHLTERALREIYLKGFEIVVKESKPWTIMSSYNKINGVLASENKFILTDILRGEWGFDGFVMTDWWAEENGARQIAAGNDLLMPGTEHQWHEIIDGVRSGRLDEALLDKAVENILRITLRSSTFNHYNYSNKPDLSEHAFLTRTRASEGMVLLKNDGTLPFSKKTKKIALFGVDSYDTLVGGSGSGNVNRKYKVNLDEGLTKAGYTLTGVSDQLSAYVKEQKAGMSENFWTVPVIPEMSISSDMAKKAAKESDIAVFTIGRMAGEGGDRTTEKGDWQLSDTEMENLTTVCKAFHDAKKKVVVVLNMGSIIEMASWKDIPDAILHAWLPGQEAGNSITDVLCGNANPSGKLPTTIAVKYEDYPSADNFPMSNGTPSEVCYDEDIFVGYRYFDTKGVKTLYPFGFGLSYTTFQYSDLNVTPAGDGFDITLNVKNTGKVEGKESVQIYVSAPEGRLLKPAKELKAFSKTGLLAPGQTGSLKMHIKKEDLASWDSRSGSWVTDPGTYTVCAAASAEDIRLSSTFSVE